MAEIHRVHFDDYDPLAAFLAGFEPDTETPLLWQNRFRLWWDQNPAFVDSHPRGWLLRHDDKIAGFLGIFPSLFQLAGRETTAFNSTTWRVLPQYRSESIKLLFQQIQATQSSILFATTPRPQTEQMLKALKFTRMRPDPPAQPAVIILNWPKLFAARIGFGPLDRILAACLAPPACLLQSYRLRHLARVSPETVMLDPQADAAFDDLWRRTRTSYSHTNVRTASAINWFCRADKNNDKKIFTCSPEGKLQGYLIAWAHPLGKVRACTLECLDLWTDPAFPDAAPALMAGILHFARENQIDLLVFPPFTPQLEQLYRHLGLLRISLPGPSEYFKAPPEITRQLIGPDAYLATQGDYSL